MDILSFLPDEVKRQMLDGLVKFLADQAEKTVGDQLADKLRGLSSEAGFRDAFDAAMKKAAVRFADEYTTVDEDLVDAIAADTDFWKSKQVRDALMAMVRRPGAWLTQERETVVQHFEDVLPHRKNRERVDRAVTFFLQCVVEELWTLPGAKEVRDVYHLQLDRYMAEAVKEQVTLAQKQLQALTQLSTDMRQSLLQLTSAMEQKALAAPSIPTALPRPRPYHNLPQPDYTRFVGRERELNWLRQRLSSKDRAWQVLITGIGGVGKSALALSVAHAYRKFCEELPPEERFEAIIWVSAKNEVLTLTGREHAAPSGLILRTLDDIYTTIAQTLEREDITRALPEDQDRLVQGALSQQRTLLIVDNLESVTDERVKPFLRNLPPPTKAILTSREWVDLADVLTLTGLAWEEAAKLIAEEAAVRHVMLDGEQQKRLFERTAGLPLPIKLSLARMAGGETFDQVVRWLGNAAGDLPEYCVKGQVDLARRRDPNAWRLLLACSLFDRNAGASREALGYMADLSSADCDDGLTLLQRLSLINRKESDRFWLLPMVREYAGSQLAPTDLSVRFTERWLKWLVGFAHCGIDLRIHGEKAKSFGVEYSNLWNAIHWCYEHQRWNDLLQLSEGTWFYPSMTALFSECREILDFAIRAAKTQGDERKETQFIRRLGDLCWRQGHDDDALKYLNDAEIMALQRGDSVELVEAWYVYSHILSEHNHLAKAERLLQKAMEMSEQLDILELKALCAERMAHLAYKRQRFDKALEWLDQGEKWSEDIGWSRMLAWITYLRGMVQIKQGDDVAAESSLMVSLSMASSWGEHRLIGYTKRRLAGIYLGTDRLQLACHTAEDAHDVFSRSGMERELAQVKELLAQIYQDTGRLELACQMAGEARDLFEKHGKTVKLPRLEELLRRLESDELLRGV